MIEAAVGSAAPAMTEAQRKTSRAFALGIAGVVTVLWTWSAAVADHGIGAACMVAGATTAVLEGWLRWRSRIPHGTPPELRREMLRNAQLMALVLLVGPLAVEIQLVRYDGSAAEMLAIVMTVLGYPLDRLVERADRWVGRHGRSLS